jgi:hypothetical protein
VVAPHTLGLLAVTRATVLASRGRFLSVRRVPVWRSAEPGAHGGNSYNAFAYANPVRHVLANILDTQKEIAVVERGPAGRGDSSPAAEARGEELADAGPMAPDAGPTEEERHHAHIVFKASVAEPVESYLYRSSIAAYLAVVRAAKRLQSGRLEA